MLSFKSRGWRDLHHIDNLKRILDSFSVDLLAALLYANSIKDKFKSQVCLFLLHNTFKKLTNAKINSLSFGRPFEDERLQKTSASKNFGVVPQNYKLHEVFQK